MNPNGKQKILLWPGLVGALFLLLIAQTAFWPDFMESRGFVPNMAVPLLVYFSLNYRVSFSMWLAFWVSLFAGALSFVPLSHLAPAWLLVCASAWASRALYFKKKGYLFFSLAFIWGFLLSALPEALPAAGRPLSFALSAEASFGAAFATLAAAAIMYPFFRICFQEESRF